jgi:hypothetical protein
VTAFLRVAKPAAAAATTVTTAIDNKGGGESPGKMERGNKNSDEGKIKSEDDVLKKIYDSMMKKHQGE